MTSLLLLLAFAATVLPSLPAEAVGAPTATPPYTPLSPARLLDTRPDGVTVDGAAQAGGAIGAGQVRNLPVLGRGGVPASGVAAVVLNVTVTGPSAPSHLTVFPAGESPPNASNLNFSAGQTVPNLVIAKVGAGGQVSLRNNSGSVQVIADVAGWFPVGPGYTPLSPARLLDTRPDGVTVDGAAQAGGAIGGGQVRNLPVVGRGGVPASGVAAVVLNVTVTGPTAPSHLTVFPAGVAAERVELELLGGSDGAEPGDRQGRGGWSGVVAQQQRQRAGDRRCGRLVPGRSGYTPLSPARLLDTS
ncbi:MAG: hypothetical protein R2726_08610 [Acidimicrobiales bacterium]